jgi:hypothetical protein
MAKGANSMPLECDRKIERSYLLLDAKNLAERGIYGAKDRRRRAIHLKYQNAHAGVASLRTATRYRADLNQIGYYKETSSEC